MKIAVEILLDDEKQALVVEGKTVASIALDVLRTGQAAREAWDAIRIAALTAAEIAAEAAAPPSDPS